MTPEMYKAIVNVVANLIWIAGGTVAVIMSGFAVRLIWEGLLMGFTVFGRWP